jgi:hypothetical protein
MAKSASPCCTLKTISEKLLQASVCAFGITELQAKWEYAPGTPWKAIILSIAMMVIFLYPNQNLVQCRLFFGSFCLN